MRFTRRRFSGILVKESNLGTRAVFASHRFRGKFVTSIISSRSLIKSCSKDHRRTRIGRCLAAVAVVLSLAGCAGTTPQRIYARYVVLISLDTARADHFGFLGNQQVQTPRLDHLAKEAIVFTDCMTVVPTTLASHTSLFTGKYPHHHGAARNGFMVNKRNEMLPEILKRAGFHTAGFAGSFALDSRFDFAQGFDHYDEDFSVFVGQQRADQDQRSAAEVTDAVIRYLDHLEIPERLFLFVHYFDPHYPYAAPAPFDRAYDPLGNSDLLPVREVLQSSRFDPIEKEKCAQRHALHYAAEISYMDHHLGRLLDDLQMRGILRDALVIVTSDHGENLWDHPSHFDHGYTLYESTMRAVCMIRMPRGEEGGARVDQLVANIDILPTVLDLLDLPIPSRIDGEAVDLWNLEQPFTARTRFGQATKPVESVGANSKWANMLKSRCIRQGRYKYIETPYRGTEELYDLRSDPGERANLLKNPSPETTALVSHLRNTLRDWADSAKPLPSYFEKSQREETIKRLRSLGYLE